MNIVPALRESCVHQGAKLAAHSDTVCIMDFNETLCKSFEEESKCHSGYYLALHNSSSFSIIKKNVKSGPKYLKHGELPWILAVLSYHENISLNKSN